MPITDPVAELDDRFSSPGAVAPPWAEVLGVIERAEIFWLTTVRGDGRPHVTPLPAIWLDGALHVCTGEQEQKAKNLEAEPRCVLTTGNNAMRTGMDVVVEGTAERVTDPTQLARLAERWATKLDWLFDVVEGGFRERRPEDAGDDLPDHGVAHVYAIAPTKVLAFGKGEPFSQTRYRF